MNKAHRKRVDPPQEPGIQRRVEDTGIYRTTTSRATSPGDMALLMRELTDRLAHIRATWLDQVETEAQRLIGAGNPRDGKLLMGHVQVIRAALATGDAEEAAYEALMLGQAVERMAVRMWEPAVKYGRKEAVCWRGAWIKVTKYERGILELIGGQDEVSVHDVASVVWHRPFNAQTRGAIDKALSLLNGKLLATDPPADVKLRRDGDRLIVSYHSR